MTSRSLPVAAAERAEGRAEGPYVAYDTFAAWGIRAAATTRAAGSFGSAGDEPMSAVLARWDALREYAAGCDRLATARQVHGVDVLEHGPGWRGWLRGPDADAQVAVVRGTVLAVTVADCVPVYLAHPSGTVAALHAGWRGTAGGILARAVTALGAGGAPAAELRLLLGPAICGGCYEVGPDVYHRLTGVRAEGPQAVDLRAVLAAQARALGVHEVFAVHACTRCDNRVYYSHRAGDGGRMLGVIWAPA